MPFTFTWTNTDPADPTAANLLGKDIRDLRSAIQERIDSVFTDPTGPWLTSDPTHPLVVAAPILGNVTGKKLFFHWSAFQFEHSDFATFNPTSHNNQYIEFVSSPTSDTLAYMAIPFACLPVGVTITRVGFLVELITVSGSTTIAGSLAKNDFVTITPTTTDIFSVSSLVAGLYVLDSGVFAHTVLTDEYYNLRILHQSGSGLNRTCRLYGARVFYNTPDCRSTY